MSEKKSLTVLLMDGPYENARTVTALRLIDIAARRGWNITAFAYEGAVSLAFAKQAQHLNAVHGRDAVQEDHPLPREWIASLIATAAKNGGKLDWINCGLCVDERGVGEAIEGTRRGSPVDFWKASEASDNTLVIGTLLRGNDGRQSIEVIDRHIARRSMEQDDPAVWITLAIKGGWRNFDVGCARTPA